MKNSLNKIAAYLYNSFRASPITYIAFIVVIAFTLYKRLPPYLEERKVVGYEAPDFFGRTMDGTNLHLRDLRGKRVILNFWATWCGPCIMEIPTINELYTELPRDGYEIFAVTTEDVETVSAFRNAHPLSYPVINDTSEMITSLFRIQVYPTFVFIDENGIVTDMDSGMNVFLKWKLRYFVTGSPF